MTKQTSRPGLAVIWDMDGVIVDTGPHHFRAWQKASKDRGVSFGEREFKRTFGMRNVEIIRTIFGESVSESESAEIADSKERYYRQFIAGDVIPLPGAIELLKDLQESGFRQAIASSSPLENVDLVLNALGIRHLFQAVVTEKDVKAGKPDPEIFLTAAAMLGIEATNCLVIEDAIAGVRAAKRAGMKCVAVSNTHALEQLRDADLVVDSLSRLSASEVKDILRQRRPSS